MIGYLFGFVLLIIVLIISAYNLNMLKKSHMEIIRNLKNRSGVALAKDPTKDPTKDPQSHSQLNPEVATESFTGGSGIVTVASEAYDVRLNPRRKVMLHHTPWCGYCKRLMPIWNVVKKDLRDTNIEFNEINEDIAKTEGIKTYPTIVMIDEYGHRHVYENIRTVEDIKNWVLSPALP